MNKRRRPSDSAPSTCEFAADPFEKICKYGGFMSFLTSGGGSNEPRIFRLGIIAAVPIIVVIAAPDLSDQSRYTTIALIDVRSNTAINWLGTFTAPPGTRSNSFAGHAEYRSVMAGRYQYVLNLAGRPIVVTLNVGNLNIGLIPPTGNLRLLQ